MITKTRGNCCFYTLIQDPRSCERTMNASKCHLYHRGEVSEWVSCPRLAPRTFGSLAPCSRTSWHPSPVSHTANVRFQQIYRIMYHIWTCTLLSDPGNIHAHPDIHVLPWFLELVSLWNILHWLWKHTFSWGFHRQKAVSVLPFCSPQAGLSLLCSAPLCLSATPISPWQLHSPAFDQAGSIKTPALHTHCQIVLCVWDSLALVP